MSGKRLDKPERKRTTTSKVIAIGVLIKIGRAHV